MAGVKRHFSPETPFMELSNAIFLHSHYRSGEAVARFMARLQ